MKERPILLNSDMVRAVLEGRKTQTRRIMKVQPHAGVRNYTFAKSGFEDDHGRELVCPLGAVGDRLWVRETWSVVSHAFSDDGLMIDYVPDRPAKAVHEKPFANGYYSGHVIYLADGGFVWGDDDGYIDDRSCWKSSAVMPRWASRITLEITSVRVERLQDISEADAKAEGIKARKPWSGLDGCIGSGGASATEKFESLWKSTHGVKSWQASPWVWVIEFKRVDAVE